MSKDATAWAKELRVFVAECRKGDPLPRREDLPAAQEWQCRIIGGSLCAWLDRWGPRFLEQRGALHRTAGVEKNALVVFSSDVAGLVAAEEILDPRAAKTVLCLRTEEYEEWVSSHDDEFRYHLHVWSAFRVPPEKGLLAKARLRFKLAAGEELWQHSEGTIWAPLAGQAADHLWKWDGHEPVLLEEAFGSRIF